MKDLRRILVGSLLSLQLCTALAGEEQQKDARSAQRDLQSLFRGGQREDRAMAMRRLKDFPPLEAAKLLVQLGRGARSPQVWRAASQMLLTWKDQREVSDYLLKSVEKKRRSKTATTSDAQSLRLMLIVLAASDQADAIDALMGLLGQIDGEVHGDVVRYLSALTRMSYGDDINAWKSWWKEHKNDFTSDKPTTRTDAPEVVAVSQQSYSDHGSCSYYGLPVRGRRLVFVIDISGSMAGPRLAMARRQLTDAIGNLPTTSEFGIVVFNHRVVVWQPNLVLASPANKDAAVQYIGRLQARGTTATYDALDAAFHFDAEAIYFLTDGKPTCGRLVDPAQIAALATQANRLRRLSIYTIGIAPGPVGSIFDTFLKTLAEQNYGSYRHLEQ